MRRLLLLLLITVAMATAANAQKQQDTEKLGMALEYFQSGKYHEALLMFKQLSRKYALNPRFQAYIGVCYYKEWDYKNAAKTLKEVLPKLQSLSPAERSVYYYSLAESLFALEKWQEAAVYYETDLTLCHPNERGDVLTRLGYCAMFREQWANAADYFASAIDYYDRFGYTEANKSRKPQLAKMLKGCQEKVKEAETKEQKQQSEPQTDTK